MRNKEDRFSFTAHSLERALERMLEIDKPYTQQQYNNIKELILKNMEWNSFDCKWILPDYDLELVMEADMVVTIAPSTTVASESYYGSKPISQFKKTQPKLCLKLGRMRNAKNREKKG